MSSEQTQNESGPRVRMAKVDSICLYQITEDELNLLEQGSPSSMYLNFALFLIPIGLSFWVTLATTTLTSDRVYYSFLILIILSLVLGVLFFCIWYKAYRSSTPVSTRIRKRLKEEVGATIGGDSESNEPLL
jgi:hypothetical protein